LIDARNYDLRNKSILLEDTAKELARVKDMSARLSSENQLLRREADKITSETYEIRKESEYQASRNLDVSSQIRDLELRLKDKEDQTYVTRKDLDNQKYTNSQMRDSNIDLLNEKEAFEKHAAILR